MYTFQDFQKTPDLKAFLINAINEHENSEDYRIAKDADEYDHHRNTTILNYLKVMYTMSGSPVVDFTASNAKIASNFFHRLNTQRATYLLGNGVTFKKEQTKDMLGEEFDERLLDLAYKALIHKVAYGYWDFDKLHVFKYTEFVPLLDEETSALRAGIRYWRIASDKPLYIVLYEEDGFTKFKAQTADVHGIEEIQPKRAYIQRYQYSEADGEVMIGEENYSSFPIIPLWGSKLHQSTLVGTREAIDSYDLVRSGFANDLHDVAEIYWLIENAGGMEDDDLARFRDRLKIQHIAAATTQDGTKVTPYTQEIPYAAREAFLKDIREQIYEDFGGLDVHQVSANSTNDHLEAAYQPLDEEADDFEYQVSQFIIQLLALIGVEDEYPSYKRNKISNLTEQTQMVLSAAEYLDEETVLNKLPFVTVDEVQEILKRKDSEDMDRFGNLNMHVAENNENEEPPTDEENKADKTE